MTRKKIKIDYFCRSPQTRPCRYYNILLYERQIFSLYICMDCNTLQIDFTKARHNRRFTRRLWCVCTRHNIIYYYFILIIIITISLSYNRLVRVAFDTSIPSPRVPAVCRPLSPRGRGSVAGFRTPKRPEDTYI